VIQHAPERVDVNAVVDLAALDLFGRQVVERSDDLTGAGQALHADGL